MHWEYPWQIYLLIQGLIADLSQSDRRFVLDMVQAWCGRLKV